MLKQMEILLVLIAFLSTGCPSSLSTLDPLGIQVAPRVAMLDYTFRVESSLTGDRNLPAKIFLPLGVSESLPVVVVSHGFSDGEPGLRYLSIAAAQAGCLVVGVNHSDYVNFLTFANTGDQQLVQARLGDLFNDMESLKETLISEGYSVNSQANVLEMYRWLQQYAFSGQVSSPEALAACQTIFQYRVEDLETVLNTLDNPPEDFPVKDYNLDELSLVGHSLGGYPILRLGGACPESLWANRIKRAVLLAPLSGLCEPERLAEVQPEVVWYLADGDNPWINEPALKASSLCSTVKMNWLEGAKHVTFTQTLDLVLGDLADLMPNAESDRVWRQRVANEVAIFTSEGKILKD